MGNSQTYNEVNNEDIDEIEINNAKFEEATNKANEILKKMYEIDNEIMFKINTEYKAFIDIEYENYKKQKNNEPPRIASIPIFYNVVIPFYNTSSINNETFKYKINIKKFKRSDDNAEENIKNYREMVSIIENHILPKFNVVLE
jgi:hypothetical protein